MKKYTIHIIGLAHLPTSREYSACAFTQKNIKAAHMFANLGHKVYLYGCEGDYGQHENITFVQTHTLDDIRQDYGVGDNRFDLGYDWMSHEFKHDFNNPNKGKSTQKLYANSIKHIKEVMEDDHILYLTQGQYQRVIAEAVGLYMTLEGGIGYRGSFAKFRAFESNYLRYFTYGSEHPFESVNGAYYDRVIPNYFDTSEYRLGRVKKDYFLYVGRIIDRKGIHTAWKVANTLGVKLVIAGQNGVVHSDGSFTDKERLEVYIPKGNWEYVGTVDREQRIKLMGEARAVFTPTIYLEAFAGVHVEAMLCGTPVITTDFGVFTDTVINGVNGYRCSTLADFVRAAILSYNMKPVQVAASAQRFTVEAVAKEYQRWFDDIHNVYLSTKSGEPIGWSNLLSVQEQIHEFQKNR